ncbi:MAG: hypothetical protein ABI679_15000 [Gemmatimonadota bacterium]
MSARPSLPAIHWKYWEMAVYADDTDSDAPPATPSEPLGSPATPSEPVRRPRRSFESFLQLVEDRLGLGPNGETERDGKVEQ